MAASGTSIVDYRWTSFDKVSKSPDDRYPRSLRLFAPTSRAEWTDGIAKILSDRSPPEEWLRAWLGRIASSTRDEASLPCPRVFISHRRVDEKLARRAAWLASNGAGVRFWLDVIDLAQAMTPLAAAIAKRFPNAQVQRMVLGFVQASVIEMALVNCTHVLALVTDQTQGS